VDVGADLALEDAFWDAAPAALASAAARRVLAQAARELLLAQASTAVHHLHGRGRRL